MTTDWPERDATFAEWRTLPIVDAVARIFLHNRFQLGAPQYRPPKVAYAEALPAASAEDIAIAEEMARELYQACDRMPVSRQIDREDMARFRARWSHYSDHVIDWMFRYTNFQNR